MQIDSGASSGQFRGTLTTDGNIGNVSAQQGYDYSSLIAANGSIGNISSLGTNSGTFAAGGTIGNISALVIVPYGNAMAGASFSIRSPCRWSGGS